MVSTDSDVSSVSTADENYLSKRQLKQGAVGWFLLTFLGVSYVISGDFSGWNFGLALGGFGGLLIATILMAIMYLLLVFCLAEMSSTLPTAGGGYGFSRCALGPWGGYITGTAIILEYAIAPAAIAVFIGGYMNSLVGIDGPLIYFLFYAVFVGIHLLGVGEAFKLMFVITGTAVVAIAVLVVSLLPHFNVQNLFDIPVSEAALGANLFLPHGFMGIWEAIPFAIWFFLAVEGVPLAAEEAHTPHKDIPKSIIYAMTILIIIAFFVLFLVPGVAGSANMQNHTAPLVGAIQSVHGESSSAALFVNIAGLAGLIASFFSITYGYSRQIFALSRAGYLPKSLSLTSRRKVPVLALIIPGVFGFLLSLTGEGDLLITMAVFGATLSYIMMCISHLLLRKRPSSKKSKFVTPGGAVTSWVALILAIVAFMSTFLANIVAACWAAIFFGIMILYFALYSRFHLVASAPEEEFAVVSKAEKQIYS
ncbi:ethanolamine permease [Zooshikella harenae]|uniref:Ethanolamine permease n=1 Tax=Zooshikella harenae TaxID=2827238 RepID=A0ABS5Z671_9GAMM|nr:ethanolamine permease [Zooshikella harenae]MBU2709547.1 ethanolamine permease [Zooshikella harenae]